MNNQFFNYRPDKYTIIIIFVDFSTVLHTRSGSSPGGVYAVTTIFYVVPASTIEAHVEKHKRDCKWRIRSKNKLRGASPVNGSKNRYFFFSSLFDCICIQKYAFKISGRNSKNCGSHEFFCHVMFDLRILELKTFNAFFSKPCFSNWRAR